MGGPDRDLPVGAPSRHHGPLSWPSLHRPGPRPVHLVVGPPCLGEPSMVVSSSRRPTQQHPETHANWLVGCLLGPGRKPSRPVCYAWAGGLCTQAMQGRCWGDNVGPPPRRAGLAAVLVPGTAVRSSVVASDATLDPVIRGTWHEKPALPVFK